MRNMLTRLAFIDETSLKTNMAKTTGWSACGARLVDHAPFGHWKTQTFLAAHRSPRAAAILKDIGAWFLFLPPYSPDLNPIEMAFAKLKALIRKAAARTYDQLWKAVGQVCDLFKEEECYNFFKAAGYETE